MQGTYEKAILWGREGLTLFRQLEENRGIMTALTHLAYTEIEQGAYERAIQFAEEVRAVSQREADQMGIAAVHYSYGWIALMKGDLHTARTHLEVACNDYKTVGFVRPMLETQGVLAFVTMQQGGLEQANMQYHNLVQQCLSQTKLGYTPQVLALALRGLGLGRSKAWSQHTGRSLLGRGSAVEYNCVAL